jgi:hypothetical protein
MAIEPYADNFAIVVPIEYAEHTDEKPFCSDLTCPCHEDQDDIALVAQYVEGGLLTPQEASDYTGGHIV